MVTLKLRLAWRQEARVLGTEAPPPFGVRLHCGNKQLAEKAFVFGHGAEKPRSGGAQQGVPGREIRMSFKLLPTASAGYRGIALFYSGIPLPETWFPENPHEKFPMRSNWNP